MKKLLCIPVMIGCIFFLIAGFPTPPAYAATETGQIPAGWAVWSCWYWPFHNSYNPNLYDSGEAMSRYDIYDPGAGSKLWEYQHHGPPQNPAPWWGHCHAWSGAAVWEPQPAKSKILGGTTFRVRDRKGVAVEMYYNCANGYNNELFVNDPSPGLFWRWLRREIKGVGSMHGHGMSFVGELYFGSEVWNYPIFKYTITYSGNPRSGTMTIYVASDASPSMADSTTLYYKTFTYRFSGVRTDSSGKPVNSGTWIGSGPYSRPDAIWRPYYANTWTKYVVNAGLDATHLSGILSNP